MSKVVEDSWLAFWHPEKKVSPARQNTLLETLSEFEDTKKRNKLIKWPCQNKGLIEKIPKTCCTLLLAKPVTQSYEQIPVDWHISKYIQFFCPWNLCSELKKFSSLEINKLAANYIGKWTFSASVPLHSQVLSLSRVFHLPISNLFSKIVSIALFGPEIKLKWLLKCSKKQ